MDTADRRLPTRNGKVERAFDRFLSIIDDSGTKLGHAVARGFQAIGLKKLAELFETPKKPASS